MADKFTLPRRYGDEQVEVIFRKAKPIQDPDVRYPGFKPSTTTLTKGTVCSTGAKPLSCDIIFERDAGITLRDGILIYADIYRPVGSTNLPALIAWSPYGKWEGSSVLDDYFIRAGVPKDSLSGLCKFEGPDPDYWCRHGYAVVNVDTRGVYNSQGDIPFWGTQEAQDGYDVIEWAAAQDWSNGKVGLTGNSWLAIMQWFIAAENPPHLAAIAPWEGVTDLYREDLARGGIIDTTFNERVIARQPGNNGIEDIPAMMRKYPLMNPYWEDKRAKLEKIKIPTYAVASWTNVLHTPGTFTGFRRISSKEKWLRVHNSHEWPDYYVPENVDDLRKFFDHYLKGIKNDWKKTPRARISVLNPGGIDIVNRPEKDFPLPRTKYRKLFLDAGTGKLTVSPPAAESHVRYRADDGQGKATFTYKFDRDTELTGYFKLRLWVEAEGSSDMDLFVLVQKLDAKGDNVPILLIEPPDSKQRELLWKMYHEKSPQVTWLFSEGAHGRLRVSRRELDPELSTAFEPYLTHRVDLPLKPKEIVPVEISLTPLGLQWHEGEQICVSIAGYNFIPTPVPLQYDAEFGLRNAGEHIIHTGGKYDSYLLIPST